MKLIDIIGEQVNPLSNQHDLRKRAIMCINAARKAYKKAGHPSPTVDQIIGFAKKNARDIKREELEAIRTLVGNG